MIQIIFILFILFAYSVISFTLCDWFYSSKLRFEQPFKNFREIQYLVIFFGTFLQNFAFCDILHIIFFLEMLPIPIRGGFITLN